MRNDNSQPGRRVSRTFVLGAFLIFAMALVLPAPVQAQCVWTGATNNLWSVATNWNNCGGTAPVNGNSLQFPNGAATPANTNDIAGLQVANIEIIGTGAGNVPYSIVGNAVELNDTLSMNVPAAGGPGFEAPVVLGQNATIVVVNVGTGTVGAIDLNGFTLELGSNAAGSTLRVEGVISGAGSIEAVGPGTLWLTTANTFNGPFEVASMTTQMTNPAALGASGAGNETTISPIGRLLINFLANADVPESFVLSGTLQADGPEFSISGNFSTPAAGSIVVPLDHILTLSGVVAGAGFFKTSGGTLVLEGNNTYAAATVLDGFLFVNGNQPASTTTVAGGVLGGTGTTGVSNVTGGTIAPGLSPGILNTGNLSVSGSMLVEMDSAVVGTGYDQTNVTGTVTLGGLLDVDLTFVPNEGQPFIIINNDGNDPVGGEFAGLPHGAIVMLDATPFHIDYFGGDGNDVVLSFAPNGVPTMPVVMLQVLVALLGAMVVRRLGRQAPAAV